MIAIGVNIIRKSKYDDDWKQFIGLFLIVGSPFAGVIYHYINDDESIRQATPQAIDVYRGKTTLQITYQDSIPVDSVVVFKDKEAK